MNSITLLPLFALTVAAGYNSYTAPILSSPPASYGGYNAPAPIVSSPPASYGYSAPAPQPQFDFVRQSNPIQMNSRPLHTITRLHHEIRQDDINSVRFDTSNGIQVQDTTKVLPGTPNPENPSELWNKIAKSGSYSYTSPEGIPISIQWTADGIHGFRATGNAIPTSPPAQQQQIAVPVQGRSPQFGY